ncbi:putative ABC transporter ATP-binding protein YbiT [termite gut metagenome]|uniref:Putative ABC transporter ATP-binding protein YbiT n=1 Tax=termite gut metagenome TaxID=433724 RepID=A0A5J4PB32_9ZZZZ
MDTVMMGHSLLWEVIKQREALYAKVNFTDEDGLKASELEETFETVIILFFCFLFFRLQK